MRRQVLRPARLVRRAHGRRQVLNNARHSQPVQTTRVRATQVARLAARATTARAAAITRLARPAHIQRRRMQQALQRARAVLRG